jgi:hypothetical protein
VVLKIFWRCMINLSFSSSPILNSSLSSVFCLFFLMKALVTYLQRQRVVQLHMWNPSSSLGFFCFFSCKCRQASLNIESSLTMHEELKVKLVSHLEPELKLRFISIFCCGNYWTTWTTFGTKSSSMVHNDPEFKLGSHFRHNLSSVFF